MASNNPNSPRQKMINLMYLVFIAMLALNVSSEVLEGFELVEESLLRSMKASAQHNDRIFSDLKDYYAANPTKTQEWYEKGVQVKMKTDSLFNYTQDLKKRIVRKGDGKNGDPEHLKHPDDLNAAYEVMFERGKNDGTKLKAWVDDYREYVLSLVTNSAIKSTIESNLSTNLSKKAKENKQTWEESMFWQMPMAASITLLTKLQNDIRYAEGEVLGDLLKNIDFDDSKVNKIEAVVIPVSQNVMRGSAFEADIVLSAQDSTQRPKVFVNNHFLPDEANGHFTVNTTSTGTFPVTGYIEIARGDGSILRRDFATQYFVTEPSATIAPVLMNVLYAGIDNEISIAVPGVVSHNISATITNGSLTRKANDIWVAKPAKIGEEAYVSVTAQMNDGRKLEMGRKAFRVRPLPPPTAFLTIRDANGNPIKFMGGAPLSKPALAGVNAVEAAIDDGILEITFEVLRFEVSTTDALGNTTRQPSDGPRFSERQKTLMRGLNRGKTVLIRAITTKGPDGREVVLNAPLEIIIN
jgi:gliding motility-associated protein GldM